MTSGFSGDFLYGGGSGGGRPSMAAMGRIQGGGPFGLRQQQQYQQQQQQIQQQQIQQQQQGILCSDQIAQARADLLMGKRSFGDFQSYQQQLLPLQQQQQQFSLLRKDHQQQQQQQQQLSFLQQQYLMRSVKQRNNSFSSSSISPSIDLLLHNNINNNINNNSISHDFTQSARFGVPIYQPPNSLLNHHHHHHHHHQQQPQQSNPTNIQLNPAQIINLGPKPEPDPDGFSGVGYSNLGPNRVEPKPEPEPENHKFMNTLQELEKQLLDDDNEEEQEGDAVSVITNSEWSETFQNLMGQQGSNPNPSTNNNSSSSNQASASTSGSNNNLISPSPTSSASSCCSSTGSPTPATFPAKQLISEAATAISDGKVDSAMEILSRLTQIGNPRGNSEQRLAFYMGNALRSRACPKENPPPVMELYEKEQMSSIYLLYDLSPCFKFGLLTANLVMLEAITSALQENLKIHVIDFDIGHGGQYMNLLRALAERRSQSRNREVVVSTDLRVSVVETELGNRALMADSVKDGLVELAGKLGINLKFNSVTRKIHELTRESLGCEEGEAVVVNFAFKLHQIPDESVSMENLRDDLLRRVKSLTPRAVTLVEKDMNANTAPFLTRVNEACGYYGALFDSLDSILPRDNSDRARVEEGLGRKMANSVACEGRDRVERAELFGKWRARMGMAGFEMKALSQSVAESMRTKLNSGRVGNPGFTVKEESGGVGFGWLGRTLTVASAWR